MNRRIKKLDYIEARENDEMFNEIFKAKMYLLEGLYKKLSNLTAPKDEIRNALVDGLMAAILTFDPEKGKTFSLYAWRCMLNKALYTQRKFQYSKDVLSRSDLINLENVVKINSAETTLSIKDILSDGSYEEYHANEMKPKLDFERLFSFASKREREILLQVIYSGKKQIVIAKDLGVNSGCISQYLGNVRAKLKTLIKYSNAVYDLNFNGKSFEEIAKQMGFLSEQVAVYYYNVYQYLYLNGEKPEELPKQEMGNKSSAVVENWKGLLAKVSNVICDGEMIDEEKVVSLLPPKHKELIDAINKGKTLTRFSKENGLTIYASLDRMAVIKESVVKAIYWAKKIHECSSKGMTDEEIATYFGIDSLKVIRREKEIYGYLFLGKEKPEQGLNNLRLPKVKLEESERE